MNIREKIWRPIPGDTDFGRHYNAMNRIQELFSGKKRAVAWVVGIGGGILRWHGKSRTQPVEHIEVAEMLRRAGVGEFKVYASDIDPNRIALAQKTLREKRVMLDAAELGTLQDSNKKPSAQSYLKSFGGTFDKKRQFHFVLPNGLSERIVLLGPPASTGNVFLETPVERPHLITCFNLSYYYSPQEKRHLAQTLAKVLAPGGTLLVEHQLMKDPFELELEKHNLKERATSEKRNYVEYYKERDG